MNRIFLTNNPEQIERVYDTGLREQLGNPDILLYEMIGGSMPQVEYIFSTWGMPAMSEAEIEAVFPNLKAVFYAAGSVQHFARAFLARGARVFSAWGANAVPVAEFIVAQIVLANKGFFQSAALMKAGKRDEGRGFPEGMAGNYGATVGLIGCGMIGSRVAQMLQQYNLHVLVDDYVSDEKAKQLGLEKCTLEELFSRSQTISNHLPDNERTKGMLGYELFNRMKPNAAFINTGRGAQVVEADLIRALEEEPNRVALLDVTEPEPPVPSSPLYRLPNAVLSPHIAGSTGCEVVRMGEYMLKAYQAVECSAETNCEVTAKMLETMA